MTDSRGYPWQCTPLPLVYKPRITAASGRITLRNDAPSHLVPTLVFFGEGKGVTPSAAD